MHSPFRHLPFPRELRSFPRQPSRSLGRLRARHWLERFHHPGYILAGPMMPQWCKDYLEPRRYIHTIVEDYAEDDDSDRDHLMHVKVVVYNFRHWTLQQHYGNFTHEMISNCLMIWSSLFTYQPHEYCLLLYFVEEMEQGQFTKKEADKLMNKYLMRNFQ